MLNRKSKFCLLPVLLFLFFFIVMTGFTFAFMTGFIDRDTEIQIGRNVSKQVENEYGGAYSDPRVTRIGKKVAAHSGRKDITYTFKVLKTDKINALSICGGFIYIFRGLLKEIGDDDDMLAFVLGHEIEHAAQKHMVKNIEKAMSGGLLLSLVFGGSKEILQKMVAVGWNLLQKGYSRQEEYEADHWGLSDMILAGYNPWGAIRLLEKFEKMGGNRGIELLNTHPFPKDRIQKIKTDYAKQLEEARKR